MKTLGEAAMDLPWIAPSALSLTALAQSPLAACWNQLRADPGFVLLFARTFDQSADTDETVLLDAVLRQQTNFDHGFIDWSLAGADSVRRDCFRLATLASALASKAGADDRRAWVAGFLAPLGWLAVSASEPEAQARPNKASLACASGSESATRPSKAALACASGSEAAIDAAARQRQDWGIDHTALARRLCRSWRLPSWLTAIISHLGLHVSIAERLGADGRLFQVVQLAVALLRERGLGLTLNAGTESAESLAALELDAQEVEQLAETARVAEPPAQAWLAPGQCPLLPELLRMALDHRRNSDLTLIERLQQELDRMQETLIEQCSGERDRLQVQKLAALAEFAAGAGHEINNPLAVISGQAQYAIKQFAWLDGPAEEIEDIGAYLANLRAKIMPSLQKIIGQTQRVHAILTDLMQFARPSTPRPQLVPIASLVHEVIESLRPLARERSVRIIEPSAAEQQVSADPAQVRLALTSLLRNAIEAAPAEGWAAVHIENRGDEMLELIVDDNGQGPPLAMREHLFDPFFSGRSAGRGRGLGLPTAWRLARQQGGDVRFDGVTAGVTRFVLTLPRRHAPALNGAVGYHTDPAGVNGVHASLAG